MKYDSVLRWWSVLAVAGASFSMGQIVGELDAIGYAQQNFSGCELPMISKSVLPHIDSFGVYGSVLAALVIVVAIVGFRLFRTEEARYRLVTAISIAAWPVVLLGIAMFFLAAYALPYAKCAAAA